MGLPPGCNAYAHISIYIYVFQDVFKIAASTCMKLSKTKFIEAMCLAWDFEHWPSTYAYLSVRLIKVDKYYLSSLKSWEYLSKNCVNF